jgi:hypothetical protein
MANGQLLGKRTNRWTGRTYPCFVTCNENQPVVLILDMDRLESIPGPGDREVLSARWAPLQDFQQASGYRALTAGVFKKRCFPDIESGNADVHT